MTQSTLDDYQDSGRIDYTDEDDLREAYWDRGQTLDEIVERSDAGGAATIRYHMNKHGIERRDISDIQRNNHAGISFESSGYLAWHSVDPDGKQRQMKVHRLLAIAEYGADAVKGKHTHHKNGIPWDNRPENIELLTPSEHHRHHSEGENHSQAKLTMRDVCEIDRLLERGELYNYEIAEKYDISGSLVTAIKNGRNWTHLTGR